MKEIRRYCELMLPQQPYFDHLSVGVVDFKKNVVEGFNLICCEGEVIEPKFDVYFDLASVSKVLINSANHALHPQDFTADMQLLLEHRGGIPAWGLLPNPGWREVINSFPIKESETLYSDFSDLRLMLEYEKKTKRSYYEDVRKVHDKKLFFWKDLPYGAYAPITGTRNGERIQNDVHDPNAWVINEFCSHAGLFGTFESVGQTLLNLEKTAGFLKTISTKMDRGYVHRYVNGWDRVENPENTLAGVGCSKHTFGHLGFTGTSVWLDADKGLGHIILSNATRDYWYAKDGLNEIRRAVGELVWS